MRSSAAHHRAARISSYPRHPVLLAPCHIAHHLTGVGVALGIASRASYLFWMALLAFTAWLGFDTTALGTYTWLIPVA